MNLAKLFKQTVIGFFLMFLISGCANYGKLTLESGRPEKMTIQELQENWDNYSIYYTDWRSVGWTGGILFDPKKDPDEVVVDFANSRVVDHSAVEAIDTLAERYLKEGKSMHIRHLSRDCRKLLAKAGDLVEVNIHEDPDYKVADDKLA